MGLKIASTHVLPAALANAPACSCGLICLKLIDDELTIAHSSSTPSARASCVGLYGHTQQLHGPANAVETWGWPQKACVQSYPPPGWKVATLQQLRPCLQLWWFFFAHRTAAFVLLCTLLAPDTRRPHTSLHRHLQPSPLAPCQQSCRP